MNKAKPIFFAIILTASIMACNDDSALIEEPQTLEFVAPSHFPELVYDLDANPISKKGFELGKRLFMDPILSRDNSISCAHCHMSSSAFTQHGHELAHGIDDRETLRNAQPIQNLAWSNSFGWDGGIAHLDLFAVNPISNPVEMDEEFGRVLQKLNQIDDYRKEFKAVFGIDSIQSDVFLKALSQFQLMCISANSKYDKYVLGKASLSELEQQGEEIFDQKCSSCHQGVLQSDQSFRNNGLPLRNEKDIGRAGITEQDSDQYKFKVPSLRNWRYTFPFMHDGRFESMEEVLHHYSEGVVNSPTLDPQLKQGQSLGIALSSDEKIKLKAFLECLNDPSFVTNPDIRVF